MVKKKCCLRITSHQTLQIYIYNTKSVLERHVGEQEEEARLQVLGTSLVVFLVQENEAEQESNHLAEMR